MQVQSDFLFPLIHPHSFLIKYFTMKDFCFVAVVLLNVRPKVNSEGVMHSPAVKILKPADLNSIRVLNIQRDRFRYSLTEQSESLNRIDKPDRKSFQRQPAEHER